ncbi:MAG TPA: protein translocase subunit SecD [Candidatus Angelobacter sp.]|nr:protein translocase subunit SecD [Candidatus Angelobacter sp.]
MQKNLLFKTVIIIAVLLIFLGGIFGIPSSWTWAGLKQAALDRVHLGLDLKGGTHLILTVKVNEAISSQSDHTIELLKEEMGKARVGYTDVSKPDSENHPERIVIQGVSNDDSGKLRGIWQDRLQQEYDLVGGAGGTWTLTMKPTQVQDLKTRTVDKSIEAIRRRVDALGVTEPVIQRNGMGNDQILVQLPGVDDPGRVKEIIQSTARLELRESRGVYSSEQEAYAANKGTIPANMVLLHGRSDRSGDRNSDVVYLVSRIPVVSGTDIRDAREGQNPKNPNKPIVNFYLTASAAKKFGEFTDRHRKDGPDPANLAIVLDNKVFSAPSIESQIFDSGYIEGDFSAEYARDLARLLQSGALPASLKYETERTVGPSLGADSIRSGVRAAIWGMVAVMVFMLIYYRAAGINADVALIFNLIILLGFMGYFGATLTLPGIAGVILTVGMGVDSNVLIFERIREELRNNKAPAAAVDQGFSRAWVTIVDTHVTTIVSAVILIFVGSGPVSGFGLTLAFGLLANLFTAVFVSRVIFDAILSRKQRGEALSI